MVSLDFKQDAQCSHRRSAVYDVYVIYGIPLRSEVNVMDVLEAGVLPNVSTSSQIDSVVQ
jgi:hypothetical protein